MKEFLNRVHWAGLRLFISCARCCWWLAYRRRPIPLRQVRSLRYLLPGDNPLAAARGADRTMGKNLRDPFLAGALSERRLGSWSLCASSLNFLQDQICQVRPSLVLEFGSGISTACLAHYVRTIYGSSGEAQTPRVVSIEQEGGFVLSTRALLRSLGLEGAADVIHAPLAPQVIEGERTACYELSNERLRAVLGTRSPDFIVIDGPASESEPSVRFGTLPLIKSVVASEARFYLDDALRDEELEIGQKWSRLPYLRIDGIHFVGKGMLIGRMTGGE